MILEVTAVPLRRGLPRALGMPRIDDHQVESRSRVSLDLEKPEALPG
jgi:hypothetical protein